MLLSERASMKRVCTIWFQLYGINRQKYRNCKRSGGSRGWEEKGRGEQVEHWGLLGQGNSLVWYCNDGYVYVIIHLSKLIEHIRPGKNPNINYEI